jgi:GNAT superfamily N-acetyltransferase
MFSIIRTSSENKDFRELIIQLDNDLNARYGKEQSEYDKHNVIELIDTVVVAYDGNQPVGCGCFKQYGNETIEIKRMFVKNEMRGKGISKMILKELEYWAEEKGYLYSILETGIGQPEAIGLYEKFNYKRIDNYGQYANMPNSVCMKKTLVKRINYKIVDGYNKMDFSRVTEMLSKSYWSPGIKINEVEKGALNSALVVGVFTIKGVQIGYARAISDKTRFAYILDVYVDEGFRKNGIGQEMIKYILNHEELKDVYNWTLITKDAHEVYKKVGFEVNNRPNDWMVIKKERPER